MVIYFQMICWNHGAKLIRYDLVCTKWTTCKLYMIARLLSRNLKWCQRPVVIGSRWPLTSKLYTVAAYLQPVQLVPDQEWKAKGSWESTQVGTVPVHALPLLLLQCFPPQMSLATNTEQWLCNIKSAEELKLKLETKLKRSDWSTCAGSGESHWEISRLVVQQAGLLRGGVAEQRMELVIKENVAAIIRSGRLVNWIIWHRKSPELKSEVWGFKFDNMRSWACSPKS